MEKCEKSRHKFVVFVFIFGLTCDFATCAPNCECFGVENEKFVVKCEKLSEISDILCNENSSFENVLEVDLSFNELSAIDFESVNNFTSLRSLNLSNNNLKKVDLSRDKFPSLQVLDLSSNQLKQISENFVVDNRNLKVVDLHGNLWHYEILSWFIDWARDAEKRGVELLHKNNITCFFLNTSTNVWEMVEACPQNCSCYLLRQHTVLQLDCNGRGLTDFPDSIPPNTRSLHLENNKIINLRGFVERDFYKQASEVYLDNNLISSVAELDSVVEREYRLSTLSLSGNKLSHLSTHAVKRFILTLGGNPWLCDCSSGTNLRNLLIARVRHILDVSNITCAADAPKHANKEVSQLSQIDLCYVEKNEFHLLDVANVMLGILIVVVLTKLLYDWWHFKHTGKLPMGPFAVLQVWNKKRLRLTNTPE